MNDKSSCSRCGTCCEKGGAVLHKEDLELIAKDLLPLSKLVTIRQGELVHDLVSSGSGKLRPLAAEVIKIAGKKVEEGKWCCVFLDGENTCAIYDNRPLQCQSFFCKDTSELEKIYLKNHLSRADILAIAPDGWLELAKTHEEECSLEVLLPLIERALDDPKAERALMEIIDYDVNFRELCMEMANMPMEMMNCVLGRPVSIFLDSFGLGFVHKNEGRVLEKIGINMYKNSL